jgi:pimeloyl-ACP methyl ester carboxylesterase
MPASPQKAAAGATAGRGAGAALCPAPLPARGGAAPAPRRRRPARRAALRTLDVAQLDAPPATSPPPRPATSAAPPPSALPLLAHEMVQGALVRYGGATAAARAPTAVLVHGVLGSRRNLASFARRLVEGFPSWQVLLLDLRCHGESAAATRGGALPGPHGVEAAAGDALRLLRHLKLFPEVLVGHSFGGKVVMSMAHQFGAQSSGAGGGSAGAANRRALPRPVRVWVLDALPGEVRSGEMGATADRPADLLDALRAAPTPLPSRAALAARLARAGFSGAVAAWAATNLEPDGAGAWDWALDLEGAAEMYRSYERADLWPLLAAPAQGVGVSFVKAERSTFRWGGADEARIRALGHEVVELKNSGHWVHADNPDGLFDLLAPSFGAPDLRLQRSPR